MRLLIPGFVFFVLAMTIGSTNGQNTDFIEKFAFADDRQEVLAQLVPLSLIHI